MHVRTLPLLLLLPSLAFAQARPKEPTPPPEDPGTIWVYSDADGGMHFVDSLDLVPAAYRASAQETGMTTQASGEARKAPVKTNVEPGYRAPKATPTPEPTPQAEAEAPADEPTAKELAAARQAILEEMTALEEGWSEEQGDERVLAERLLGLEAKLTELDRKLGR
jgi:hypothetical protein